MDFNLLIYNVKYKMMEERKLPTIKDIYSDESLEIIRKSNDLNWLMNQKPKKEWLMKHPLYKKESRDENGKKILVPIDYITIQRVEWLLTTIFVKWRVEVRDVKLIANSVTCTVRIHYLDPVNHVWDWQDGVGAAPLQTDKDAGAVDFNAIKSNAVMIGLPAAKSFAIKDAAEMLGKLFGKDLNRVDDVLYSNLASTFEKSPIEIVKEKIASIETIDELFEYYETLPPKIQNDVGVNALFADKKNEFDGNAPA